MKIEKIFFKTIVDFNKSQNEYEIDKSLDFLIIGSGSALDSLACVNFFTMLEKNIFKDIDKEIDIINKIFSIKKDKIKNLDLLNFLKENI